MESTGTKEPIAKGSRATKRPTATKKPENLTSVQKQAGKAAAARQRQGQNDKEKPEKRQKKSGKKNPKPVEMVTNAAVQPRTNRDGTKKCTLCHEWLSPIKVK